MQIADFAPQEVLWCDTCRGHIPGTCDGCHEPIAGGYRSQSYHYHPMSVAGVGGTVAIHKSLCKECYWQDMKRVYPTATYPFPVEEGEAREHTDKPVEGTE